MIIVRKPLRMMTEYDPRIRKFRTLLSIRWGRLRDDYSVELDKEFAGEIIHQEESHCPEEQKLFTDLWEKKYVKLEDEVRTVAALERMEIDWGA